MAHELGHDPFTESIWSGRLPSGASFGTFPTGGSGAPSLGGFPAGTLFSDIERSLGITSPSANVPFASNPFADFLETEPEIPYQGALSRANLTPNQLRTFRSQRQNIFNQFLSQLDEQMRAGQLPSARFADFIGEFNFPREYQRFAPSERMGAGISRFAPPTRVVG